MVSVCEAIPHSVAAGPGICGLSPSVVETLSFGPLLALGREVPLQRHFDLLRHAKQWPTAVLEGYGAGCESISSVNQAAN